jgi:hypothetical protein
VVAYLLTFGGPCIVARSTESKEIALLVLNRFVHHQFLNVVYVLSQLDDALGLAVDAEWMLSEITETEALPFPVVASLTG